MGLFLKKPFANRIGNGCVPLMTVPQEYARMKQEYSDEKNVKKTKSKLNASQKSNRLIKPCYNTISVGVRSCICAV